MHTSIDRERAGADLKPTLTYNYNYLSITYNQGQLYPYMDYTFLFNFLNLCKRQYYRIFYIYVCDTLDREKLNVYNYHLFSLLCNM